MKRFIFYFLVAASFLLYIIINFHRDKVSKDSWKNKITFNGVIQNVVHIKHEKGSFFKVNDEWYNLSYYKKYEEQNFIGLKIEKRINEEGIWIEKSEGSDSLVFYWSRGDMVKDDIKLKILNQKSKVPD